MGAKLAAKLAAQPGAQPAAKQLDAPPVAVHALATPDSADNI